MLRFLKLALPLALIIGLFSKCTDGHDDSPFAKLLEEPPYDMVTDSIHKSPKNDELYFHRAILLNRNNLPEPALADFRKAWSLKKDERYAFGISKILSDKKPDSAVLFLKDAMNEFPQSILLLINLAESYAAQNKIDEAIRTCDLILQEDPRQLNILTLKARLLDQKGDLEAAIVALEQAYSVNPRDPQINHALAFKYAQAKSPKTLAFCDSLIQRDPGHHAEPYYFKGVYFSNMNNKGQALYYFNEAIEHDYNFLDAHMEKGQLLFDEKKFNEALKAFSLVTTIDPTFADGYYWIGKCQEVLGDKSEAKANYQRAYGLDKSLIEAKEAAEKIKD